MSRPKILYREQEGWIKWPGGTRPEHADTIVKPWLKSLGEGKPRPAGQLDWGKRIDPSDGERLPGSILGYKVIEEAGQ